MLKATTLLLPLFALLFPTLAQRAHAQRIAEGYSYAAPRAEKLDDAAAHAKLLNWVEDAARAREHLVYFRNTSDQPLDITSYEFYECLNVSGVKCGVEHEGPRLEPGETIVLKRIRHRNMDQRMSYRYRFYVQFAAAPQPDAQAPRVPETGWPAARVEYVDRVVPILMRNHGVPGAAIVLVDGRQIQWSAGYGIASPDSAEVTPRTVFEVGSLGEPVVALTLQRLAEVRSWYLEAPISTWAHEESYPAGFGSVTAAELLSHTGGVRYDAAADRFVRLTPPARGATRGAQDTPCSSTSSRWPRVTTSKSSRARSSGSRIRWARWASSRLTSKASQWVTIGRARHFPPPSGRRPTWRHPCTHRPPITRGSSSPFRPCHNWRPTSGRG